MKKNLKKKAVPVLTALGLLIGGLVVLKLIADSQSRVDY